jgi:ABC-type polysaccharide transport system permease subunit
VIPVAATVIMFKFMAQPDIGLINIILKLIGFKELNRYWFGDLHAALPFIMLLHLWRNVPFYGIAFLAAMQAIPRSYYEAAEIDGASAWQRFVHITLPGIRGMIIVMVTIHVVRFHLSGYWGRAGQCYGRSPCLCVSPMLEQLHPRLRGQYWQHYAHHLNDLLHYLPQNL